MARRPVIAYDSRDFLSMSQTFRRYLSSNTRFSKIWTSFNPENPATAYMKLLTYLANILFVYQKWAWNQLYTTSMTTTRTAIDNATLINKELRSASPATR